MRVLMLASDAHGGFGGIAQYNRDVLEALSKFDRIEEVVVLPRIVGDAAFSAPPRITYDLKSANGRLSFVGRSLRQAVLGGRFDLVYCAHINLMPIAARIAQLRKVPLLLAIYGIDAWKPPAGQARKLAAQCPDLVISISEVTLRRFQEWSGFDEARTVIVPNAIRAELYGPGKKNVSLLAHHGLAGRKVIMTFGRMAPEERYKGFDEIIEQLPDLRAKVPDLAYLAVGDGGDRPRLEAKACDLDVIDMVVFAGRIPEDLKPDYFRLADAYVMPSSGEGFGFVVIEALACGIPVVASTMDGTREAVRNGELGLIVDPSDPTALQSAILQALQQPKEVPAGLEYFAFKNFASRIEQAISCAAGREARATT